MGLAVAGTSGAQEVPDELFASNRSLARVGVYDISMRTRLRADSSDGSLGTTIDLENDLNLDENKSTSYLGLSFRAGGPHLIELEHFALNRTGTETLTAEIEFGDEVFEVGARVDSFFNTEVMRLGYAYVIRETDNYAVALSAGVHVTELASGITDVGPAGAGLATVGDTFLTDVTAPLPTFGITAGWNLADRLYLYGRAQYFQLSISDYDGRIDHVAFKLEYDLFDHVGIGVGYDMFGIKLTADRGNWDGSVEYRFKGPMFFLTGRY